MNKKMFFGIITSVLLVCSAVFFLACTKDTENKQELSTELTKEQKDVVKNALAVSDGKILPLGSQEHKLNQLSESQFAYAIGLLKQDLAQSWREDNSKHEIGWDYNDYYNLSDAQHDAIIKIATQLFKKPSNQITNSEYLDIIDNHYSEVINEVLNTTSSEKIKKLFEGKNKNSSQASSQRVVARRGCPAYYYGIRTTVSDSGNRSCRMSSGATNRGDQDCDYEFTFDWDAPYSPRQLSLRGTSWGVRRILQFGGINGRLHSTYSSGGVPNRVSFLIGAGRITLFYPFSDGVSEVRMNLLGNWGLA